MEPSQKQSNDLGHATKAMVAADNPFDGELDQPGVEAVEAWRCRQKGGAAISAAVCSEPESAFGRDPLPESAATLTGLGSHSCDDSI